MIGEMAANPSFARSDLVLQAGVAPKTQDDAVILQLNQYNTQAYYNFCLFR